MMEVYRVGNKEYIKNLTGEAAFLFELLQLYL